MKYRYFAFMILSIFGCTTLPPQGGLFSKERAYPVCFNEYYVENDEEAEQIASAISDEYFSKRRWTGSSPAYGTPRHARGFGPCPRNALQSRSSRARGFRVEAFAYTEEGIPMMHEVIAFFKMITDRPRKTYAERFGFPGRTYLCNSGDRWGRLSFHADMKRTSNEPIVYGGKVEVKGPLFEDQPGIRAYDFRIPVLIWILIYGNQVDHTLAFEDGRMRYKKDEEVWSDCKETASH